MLSLLDQHTKKKTVFGLTHPCYSFAFLIAIRLIHFQLCTNMLRGQSHELLFMSLYFFHHGSKEKERFKGRKKINIAHLILVVMDMHRHKMINVLPLLVVAIVWYQFYEQVMTRMKLSNCENSKQERKKNVAEILYRHYTSLFSKLNLSFFILSWVIQFLGGMRG